MQWEFQYPIKWKMCAYATQWVKKLTRVLVSTTWTTANSNTWAMTWQNQQNECAPSEDSDQPRLLPSLIRVFAVRSMGSLGPKVSSCGQRRLLSDWADAQADLSLRRAHTHFVGFVMSRLTCIFWFDFCFTTLQHILGHFGRGQLT